MATEGDFDCKKKKSNVASLGLEDDNDDFNLFSSEIAQVASRTESETISAPARGRNEPIEKESMGNEGQSRFEIVSHVDKKTPAFQHSGKHTEQKKSLYRTAAGEVWKDRTLADWPDDDYRLFVGNLAPEVTDDMLSNTFRPYGGFARARVVAKKGYGFVSFLKVSGFVESFKAVNGKYIGSRPVALSRVKTEDRTFKKRMQTDEPELFKAAKKFKKK